MPRGRIRLGSDELSRMLAKIRDDAGLSGVDAARRAGEGFSQSKVSRWESGTLLPSPEDVERYTRALGAPASVRRHLVSKARDLAEQHKASRPPRVMLKRANYQKRVGRIEAEHTHIATFHPVLIPGLLQTVDYMRAVFAAADSSPEAVAAAVAARLDRQQILSDETRQFTFITTVGALGWRGGSPEAMAAQIEHIEAAGRRPNVEVGVIRWGVEATVFPPAGFDLYDERLVIVGVGAGAAHITDPQDVAAFVGRLSRLERLAAHDNDARTLLARAAADYRG